MESAGEFVSEYLMQMVAGFTVGQLIVAFVLIPTFYRLKVVSLYEYLDDRFGVR